MLASLKDIQRAVDDYSRKYRRPGMAPIKVGQPYCLFPERLGSLRIELSGKWPESWPDGARKGVYLVLNRRTKVAYVGKASMSSAMGSRLSAWFPGRASCKIKGTWKEEPFFVATVPVPDDTPFEAAALEEYLIQKFGPPDNTRGVTRDVYDH